MCSNDCAQAGQPPQQQAADNGATPDTSMPELMPAFRGAFSPRVAPPPAPLAPATAGTLLPEVLEQEQEFDTTHAGFDDARAPSPAGTASAPEFPRLAPMTSDDLLEVIDEAVTTRAIPVSPSAGGDELDIAQLSLNFDPPMCTDCNEFFASDQGRCSLCARAARGELATTVSNEEGSDDTPMDMDDKMVMVGAAVVGASIGALAGGLAAVVGAGAGAWAATRPQGDKVGDSARYAGRSVVQVGGQAASKVHEVGEKLKVAETAEKLAATAAQKARDANLAERTAMARERLEHVVSSLDNRAREFDAHYQVSDRMQKVSERLNTSVRQAAAVVAASPLGRWASDQAAGHRDAPGRGGEDFEISDAENDKLDAPQEEHC